MAVPEYEQSRGITPRRAAVSPIVVALDGCGSLRLERVVSHLVERRQAGAVAVLGGQGSGKTTAVEHLAAVLPPGGHCILFDEPRFADVARLAMDHLVVYTGRSPEADAVDAGRLAGNVIASYRMAAWGMDEWIEYLLSAHRDECKSVMERLKCCDDLDAIDGSPQLSALVLDLMARDATLTRVSTVLRRFLDFHLHSDMLRRDARTHALGAFFVGVHHDEHDVNYAHLRLAGCAAELLSALRNRAVLRMLAAERVLADLDDVEASLGYFVQRLMPELIEAVGQALDARPARRARLTAILSDARWSHRHGTAAGLLHATPHGWTPTAGLKPDLSRAHLPKARWAAAHLRELRLVEADLVFAELHEADLTNAQAQRTSFLSANLHGANLTGIDAAEAEFVGADLSHARAYQANLRQANFTGARLEGALLKSAILRMACLRGAALARADLTDAILCGADLTEADFTSARLDGANLRHCDLRTAALNGASFRGADLEGAILEDQRMLNADFSGAIMTASLLTGTFMPHANFREADLRQAGLAEIDWEGADLREADLRNSSFHAGSSRCGNLDSPIACEGSRTGFYTDDFDEQTYRPPEEIRKANLRGADLRGARVENTDFYLVDLRDAHYDAEQEAHFRRCGAILETRV